MNKDLDNYYFKITLSYEIPYNVLDSKEENVVKAREILYENLKENIPEKYERFSVKLVLYQLRDTYNYLVTYDSFFRCSGELPMAEWKEARDLKDMIKGELEEFFDSVDCEYKQLSIKTLS